MERTVLYDGAEYFDVDVMRKTSEAHGLSYEECLSFQSDSLNRDYEELGHKLSKSLGREIIGLARFDDYTFTKRHLEDLSDILYVPSDGCREDFSVAIEEDIESEVCGSDGLLFITYRLIKPYVSEEELNHAISEWNKCGDYTEIMSITESLVPYVCDTLGIN